MDFRSLSSTHVHPCDLFRHAWEDRGQTVTIEHADSQRWFYLAGHRTDEVTMLKIWDSSTTEGVANGKSSNFLLSVRNQRLLTSTSVSARRFQAPWHSSRVCTA